MELEAGTMIANYNTAPAAGYAIIWAWIGVCFIASAVLIVLDALLRPRVVFGLGILENERRRREDVEEEVIELESKVSAQEIRISYLEGENETLRELARRKGFFSHEEENNDFGRFGFRHAQPDEETAEAEWMNRKFENKIG